MKKDIVLEIGGKKYLLDKIRNFGIKMVEMETGLTFPELLIKISKKNQFKLSEIWSIIWGCVVSENKTLTYDDFLISSFNHYELRAMRSFCPRLKLGAVVAGIPIDYAECAVKVNAYSIHLSKEFITQAFVDDAHQRGLKVFVYTINDRDYFEKMTALGIDGIFTDYPDRFSEGL